MVGGSGPQGSGQTGCLVATGILDEPYLLGHSTIGTFVGLVHILMPPAVLSIYTIMSRIDENLMTTARSLGAGKLTAFFTIFFPSACRACCLAAS